MAFAINFPRNSRPRGLGYVASAQHLTGLGTWVVDAEYGLGPRFRAGYAQPYPKEALPTRYPRAQAARVLGPSGAANVVARPFAATRMPLTRYPVRMAPITAPGARMRNPGVAGLGAEELAVRMPSKMLWGGMATVAGLGALWIFLRSRKKKSA